jgi:type III pantothenate kinase
MKDPDAALLALDAGNTRIKWGVHDGHAWSARGAIDTAGAASLYEALRNALPVDRAIASNVAGTEVRTRIEEACARARVAVDFIAALREQCGVRSLYADPAQLGPDRWAALIAAHHGDKGHKLVVNVGTALTVDALSAEGEFLGGLIVPGPALMRRSLDRGTAGLRLTEGEFQSLPRSTPDAITSGALQACLGAIERLGKAMASRAAAPDRIILSGGAAGQIEAMLPYVHTFRENLVLEGLLLIACS